MKSVFIFSGTSEGRELTAFLAQKGIPCVVSVATEYGEEVMEEMPGVVILSGRMTADKMAEKLKQDGYALVVDATHPFAVEVKKQIRQACDAAQIPYMRMSRDAGTEPDLEQHENCYLVDSAEEAALLMEKLLQDKTLADEKNILLTTGSKDLHCFAAHCDDKNRLYARVLPNDDSLSLCRQAGLASSHIIAMQGPFSTQMNVAMLRQINAGMLITKQSGPRGGYRQKLEAGIQADCLIIVIRNPELHANAAEKIYSQAYVENYVLTLFGKNKTADASMDGQAGQSLEDQAGQSSEDHTLYLIGCGMGSGNDLTMGAWNAIKSSQMILGAPRVARQMQEMIRKNLTLRCESGESVIEPKYIETFRRSDILSILAESDVKRAAVLFSGDTGFHSGASEYDAMEEVLDVNGESICWRIVRVPGISTVASLCAKTGQTWEDMKLCSLHGEQCDVEEIVRTNRKSFFLTSGRDTLHAIADALREGFNKDDIKVYIGYQLSYPEELILTGDSSVLTSDRLAEKGLYAIIIENAGILRRE